MTPNRSSRCPGFYRLDVPDRRRFVAENGDASLEALESALTGGGLTTEAADKIVENVVGTYALPFAVALNVAVNGRDYLVPMVVEEPSVVAAASNAAKMVRAGGGFRAEADPPIMTGQIEIHGVGDLAHGTQRILAAKDELLAAANRSVAGLLARGGGARDLEVRPLTDDTLVLHVYVDCRDAMGANLVNTVAEALGDRVAELAGGQRGLRILSNLSDHRCVRVRCVVPAEALATDDTPGSDVINGIVQASRFAEIDPYRAATHNKGIMNGLDAVCMATGNDWRAVEAGAHAYAARTGRYLPLSTFRAESPDNGPKALVGSLTLPLALGTVGGTLRVHPAARIALAILGNSSAADLACVAASLGLASNLAALRALATSGIQKGHMALHARSVAVAAGCVGEEVETVARQIAEGRTITRDAAVAALLALRAGAERVR